jgi:hypothetical protein
MAQEMANLFRNYAALSFALYAVSRGLSALTRQTTLYKLSPLPTLSIFFSFFQIIALHHDESRGQGTQSVFIQP